MTLFGHARNGIIVLDQAAELPDGTPVRVEVIEPETAATNGVLARRQGGQYAGQIVMTPDFDEWPFDIQESLGIVP